MTYDGPRPRPGQPRSPKRLRFPAELHAAGGNLRVAAQRLGVSHTTAWRWWRELQAGTLTDHVHE